MIGPVTPGVRLNEIDEVMREAAAALQECMSGDDASGLSRYAAWR